MPNICCVRNCKSTREKNSEVKFYRFPFQNGTAMKYWIAATGRDNWSPYAGARLCSLHFKNTDYYNNVKHNKRRCLKPDVIPTQYVHASILQVFQQNTNTLQISQQDKIHKVKEHDQNNTVSSNKEELAIKVEDEENSSVSSKFADSQNDTTIKQENMVIEDNNNEATSANWKCFKCSNYNKILNENEQLKKEIDKLKELQEERLNQQASMFHSLMNHKETALKDKLRIVRDKNKTLQKSIKRKTQQITNLKTLLKYLKSKILKTTLSSD